MNSQTNSWTAAVARHTRSSNAYVKTALAVSEHHWIRPVGEGKWSPAQITEHLNRTYEIILAELRGEKGIRIRSPWLLRQLLRQTILRSIYRKRQLPRGARAPSEIMPKVVKGTQTELVERFTDLARKFDDEVLTKRDGSGQSLTHHIFGKIDLLKGVDFVAIHVEHHHKQIMGDRDESKF